MPSIPPTVVLYGPSGCGKTRLSELLCNHLGCTKVVDNWTKDEPVAIGALHLTNVPPSGRAMVAISGEDFAYVDDIVQTTFLDVTQSIVGAVDAAGFANDPHFTAAFLNALADKVHADNVAAGWWSEMATGQSTLHTRNVPELLMLVVSEIAEAMEGHRKGLMDDKLPDRPMLQTELVDAVIRILDIAGSRTAIERANADRIEANGGCRTHNDINPIGDIFEEKRAFNKTRPDHKIESRLKPGGKAF
jgi:hypothetical protein